MGLFGSAPSLSSTVAPLSGAWGNIQQGTGSWDPQGLWTDPQQKGKLASRHLRKSFNPQYFMADLLATPEAQNYANVGDLIGTQGVEGVRRGEAQATEEAKQGAANQGLGRGFAQQAGTDIRQQGTETASTMLMAGELEERQRRYGMQQMMAQSLIEANKSLYGRYLFRKQLKAGHQAAQMGMIGAGIQAVGSFLGGPGFGKGGAFA